MMIIYRYKKWVSSAEVRSYIEREISYIGCNSAYLSHSTVNNLIEDGEKSGYYKKEESIVMKKKIQDYLCGILWLKQGVQKKLQTKS